MKDYASMSDEQIAVMVARLCTIEGVSINEDGMAVRNVVDESPGSYSGGDYIEFDFDPCNNPEDAWPIILQNRISVIFDSSDESDESEESDEWVKACVGGEEYFVSYHYCHRALRAAMVAFLMMKEGE